MSFSGYIAKTGKVYVTTLVTANTWYQVLTAAESKAIRGVKVKSRFVTGTAPAPFDTAFKATPDEGDSSGDGFITNLGMGFGDTISPSNGLWCRSSTAGAIIEAVAYE